MRILHVHDFFAPGNSRYGFDMNRLLVHIARLEREVRDLRNQLADRENAEYLASLAARHDTKQAALPKAALPKAAKASGKQTGAAKKASSPPRSKAG